MDRIYKLNQKKPQPEKKSSDKKLLIMSGIALLLSLIVFWVVKSRQENPLKAIDERHANQTQVSQEGAEHGNNGPQSEEKPKGKVYESKYVKVQFNPPEPREEPKVTPQEEQEPEQPDFEKENRHM